jgi:sugar transferase EpsL
MLKRTFDFAIALIVVTMVSPLILVTAIAVAGSMGSPVLFRQLRPGLHGRSFEVLKFRTMAEAVGADGQPLPDEVRLTKLGAFLRRFSLDELPQLFNVIKGDMSLVGPRPLLMEYLPLYSAQQMRRHEVRPGITGWTQVNGRNALSWEDKFALDVWYVDHQSFWLDLKILAMTAGRVFSGSGVSKEGFATTEKFRGTSEK